MAFFVVIKVIFSVAQIFVPSFFHNWITYRRVRIFPYFFEHENNPVFWSAQMFAEGKYPRENGDQVDSRLRGNDAFGSNWIFTNWRVWFWLRTNAGGVVQACKSHDSARNSGRRVSNTWAIYPRVGDNISKEVLIPDNIIRWHHRVIKGGASCRLRRSPRPIS